MNTTNWLGFSLSPHDAATATATTHHPPSSLLSSDLAIADSSSSSSPFGILSMPDLSMHDHHQPPKLEDFLGGGGPTTFLFSDVDATNVAHHNSNGCNTMGLSMIKSWLRNQPAPPVSVGEIGGVVTGSGSQCLALSMSTGSSHTSEAVALVGGGVGESSSTSDGKQTAGGGGGVMDEQSGAIVEATPRKSIDTFGQRTSIYRGVTR